MLNKNGEIIMIYQGESMNPTFLGADILHIKPYNGGEIREGDVIVFFSPEDKKNFITHRIISVNNDIIRTKGDNCEESDQWVLSPQDIIGKVINIRRGDKVKQVYGGTSGVLYCYILNLYKAVKGQTFSALRPIYHSLAKRSNGRCGRHICSKNFSIRLVAIKKTDGEELQLLMGKHLIGRLRPKGSRWEIKRPFRVFINTEKLPKKGVI